MKTVALLCIACVPLSGCFFFMVPLPRPDADRYGNACVAETVKVGDTVKRPDGQAGIVQKIYERSARCRDDKPIIASVL